MYDERPHLVSHANPPVTAEILILAGIQAEQLMKTGGLVPDSTILRLIMAELTSRGWLSTQSSREPTTLNSVATSTETSGSQSGPMEDIHTAPNKHVDLEYNEAPSASFILDGFPRTKPQAEQLATYLPINMVVQISTPTEVILDRICNRWVHPPSGRVYNTTFNAPKEDGKDDITGELLVQRDDDKPEVWKSRLEKFWETSLPLLEHYDKLGVLWKVQGNSSDEISPKLFAEFGKRFGV